MISASEIRRRFIEYFKSKGHEEVASSALIPKDDPSLLFTNAGMVQFKNIFLGQEVRDYKRATTSQKCLRVGGKHNDLENVGRTARHHTFFEMLGNFSFGDYFKREAIGYAWEFITEDLGLPKDKLYITIYTDDDEADELWQEVAGVPAERIYRLGEKDNFWSMGDTGPCGPCSEIHYDQGEDMCCGPDCGIGKCDCDRYLEIWNLVFMQYNQDADGTRTPLPKPSIDTGMGLERIAAICQGVQSNFDIDLFQEIISFTARLAGVSYKSDDETDTALRVIADHSRSIAFMIADGIQPSNEGRGYVLRRLLRRACRFGKLIGLSDPFLCKTTDCVVEHMGDAFPELKETREFMVKLVRQEEERFGQTLDKGLVMLEEEIERVLGDGSRLITGEFAFKLYDTYGFPLDIVNDVAEKQGVAVDEEGYKGCMAEQKERAKAAWKGSGEAGLAGFFKALLEKGVESEFVGYDALQANSKVLALLDTEGQEKDSLAKGESGFLVAAATPFYGESGGQVGDVGFVVGPKGTAQVTNTLKPAASLMVHEVTVQEGGLATGEDVSMEVDEEARQATARNHTTTHLLQAALQKVLGDHVKQAGSLVGPDRLRFDFTHISAMSLEEIQAVEAEVNRAILADIGLEIEQMDYQDAVAKGAMALFGEKYADTVRVVSVPDVSVELCGGTHLSATGQAGPFMILSESGVAAGVRRIEGATGFNSLQVLNEKRFELDSIAGLLKAKSPKQGEVEAKVKALRKEIKKLNKEMEKLATQAASASSGGDIMDGVKEIAGVKVLCAKVGVPNAKALRDIMDDIRSKLQSGIACLAADVDGKAPLILYVSKDLHKRFTAPALIKDVAAEVGGGGGGRPDMAQAGGANPANIPNAFKKLEELVAG